MDVPFPHPATNDHAIWELHGDVAGWDSSVAGFMNGVVDKIAKGRRPLLSVRLRTPSFEKKIQRLLQA